MLNFSILRYHLSVLVLVTRGVVPLTSSRRSVAGENNGHDHEFVGLAMTEVRRDLQMMRQAFAKSQFQGSLAWPPDTLIIYHLRYVSDSEIFAHCELGDRHSRPDGST